MTDRDTEILRVLHWTPATAQQLLKASATFAEPFTDIRRARERLQVLAKSGFVRSWQYATTGRGALNYYKLSRSGFDYLNGLSGGNMPPPEKRFFEKIALARQEHTRSLADVVIHTMVSAHQCHLAIADYRRENSVRLQFGDYVLQPDGSAQLTTIDGKAFQFFIELDNSTEPLRSERERESIQRKIMHYEALQDERVAAWRRSGRRGKPIRFRVLFFTKSVERRDHILWLARNLARNKDRRLALGIYLPDYLTEECALCRPVALDHHGHWQSPTNTVYRSQFLRERVNLVEPPLALFV